MVLEHQGIPTAPFAVVPALWTPNDPTAKTVSQLLESIHAEELKDFPLFIKPACEGSSKGIYPFSKVTGPSELEDGVQKLQARFPGQSILVERYLAGNEYTVSLLGTGSSAKVLGSLQVNWSNPADGGFFTVFNKNEEGNDHLDQFVDAHNNPEVQAAEDLALRAWRALECYDVGRVDVRFGANGKPYVLEVCLTPPHAHCRTNYHSSIHCLGCVHNGLTWYKPPSITVSVMRYSWGELLRALCKDIRICARNEVASSEGEDEKGIKGIIGLCSYNILAFRPRTRGNHLRSKGPRQTTKHRQVMCVSEMPSSRPLK